MYGRAQKNNMIISSDNPVVADSVGAQLLGMSLKKIRAYFCCRKGGIRDNGSFTGENETGVGRISTCNFM